MMKYVFVLALLTVGGAGGLMGYYLAYHWIHNMAQTQRVMPGEQAFSMPAGVVPREGGELTYAKEDRDRAAARKSPVSATPESARVGGELFAIYCAPCHGAGGKGDGTVATKFVPPPDLTNADFQRARTDGYWQHVLSVGGAVMPAYGEALTAEERWHVVNFLRTLAQR